MASKVHHWYFLKCNETALPSLSPMKMLTCLPWTKSLPSLIHTAIFSLSLQENHTFLFKFFIGTSSQCILITFLTGNKSIYITRLHSFYFPFSSLSSLLMSFHIHFLKAVFSFDGPLHFHHFFSGILWTGALSVHVQALSCRKQHPPWLPSWILFQQELISYFSPYKTLCHQQASHSKPPSSKLSFNTLLLGSFYKLTEM